MTLISFQHSIKYINVQMAPYVLLTAFTGYMATAWIYYVLRLLAMASSPPGG